MDDFFGAANRLTFNADVTSKATALAADYFKQGKSTEWVLENVCGSKRNSQRAVIAMAEGLRLITRKEGDALRERYNLISKGKK